MSHDLNLRFTKPWTQPNAADLRLRFPEQALTPPIAASGRLSARLGAPRAKGRVAYDAAASRPTVGHTGAMWAKGRLSATWSLGCWRNSAVFRITPTLLWLDAANRFESRSLSLGSLQNQSLVASEHWRSALMATRQTADQFASLRSTRVMPTLRFENASQVNAQRVDRYVQLVPKYTSSVLVHQKANAVSHQLLATFHVARKHPVNRTLPWDRAGQPKPGRSVPIGNPTNPNNPTPRTHPNLNFCCALELGELALQLNFSKHPRCRARGSVVPTLKVYVVNNAVDVVRLPGREPIAVKSISLSIDADSWAWGMTASIPLSALALVEPTSAGPTEIEISVNGVLWILLVEGFDARREFGSSEATIRGRSRAAWLAEPYAPARSFTAASPFTTRQLAELELERADWISGFSLDWQLPDWLVPEGVWSYESQTPMQAISRIVTAVGGTLNAHPSQSCLIAASRYPNRYGLPWQWSGANPDRSLPIEVVKTLSARWQEKPNYNAVYVAGERQGVIARVTRSGTAADLLASMVVVDPLITHADAARERGRAVLADTGRQALVTLELPMLPSIGLLHPGKLLELRDVAESWRGLVRGTTVSASWSQSLMVRQVVEVERRVSG
jgi:hypothetical protein